MDQHVAQVDDPSVPRNPLDENGVKLPKAVQRLADGLELALDRRLRQRVAGICVAADPFGEALDFLACLVDIRQQHTMVRRHIQARATD